VSALLKNWPLFIIPTALYCAAILAGSRQLEKTYQRLRGEITSEEDLMILKRAINLNMMVAIFLMAFAALYFGIMFYLAYTRYIAPLTAVLYSLLLGFAGLACTLLYGRKIEKRVKNMTIMTENPQILETYIRWVKQWDEPRLRLPD
jgi:hypothetical protein